MKKTFIAISFALAAAFTAPAVAGSETAAKTTFTHEGVTYVYSKTIVGKSTVYRGYARPGHDFYLVARNGQVTGKANGIPVSFDVPKTEIAGTIKLASR